MLQGKKVTKEIYKQTNRKIIPLKSEEIKKKNMYYICILFLYQYEIIVAWLEKLNSSNKDIPYIAGPKLEGSYALLWKKLCLTSFLCIVKNKSGITLSAMQSGSPPQLTSCYCTIMHLV